MFLCLNELFDWKPMPSYKKCQTGILQLKFREYHRLAEVRRNNNTEWDTVQNYKDDSRQRRR